MKHNLFLLIVCIFLGTSRVSANYLFPVDSINKMQYSLDSLLSKEKMATEIRVSMNGEKVFERYSGYIFPTSTIKPDSTTLFGIASMSKEYTAMAVLMLADEGKLSLDDNINTYFDFPELRERKITIRQLLSHTSGLPELTRNENFMNTLDSAHTIDQVAGYIFTGEFRSQPGEKFIYNNSGFTLLAALIEKLSGVSYRDFLTTHILLPLHMNHTYVCDFYNDANTAAPRFEANDSGYVAARVMHFSNLIGGGSIVTNTRDIARWDYALLTGNGLPANYKEMFKPVSLQNGEEISYGLGMGITEFEGKKLYYHPGMGDGMSSINLIFPDYKLDITVIRNVSGTPFSSVDLGLLVAHYFLPEI
jgi:D-alanyl-D-alanine carboxypeptidase